MHLIFKLINSSLLINQAKIIIKITYFLHFPALNVHQRNFHNLNPSLLCPQNQNLISAPSFQNKKLFLKIIYIFNKMRTYNKLPRLSSEKRVILKKRSYQSLFGEQSLFINKGNQKKLATNRPIRSISNDIKVLEDKSTTGIHQNRIKMRSVHLKKSENSPLFQHVMEQPIQTENEDSLEYEQEKFDELTKSRHRFNDTRQLIQSARECLSHRSQSPLWDKYNYAREDINIFQKQPSPNQQKKEFFQCYKNYERAQQIVETFSLHPNLYIKMLAKAKEKDLFPKTLSLVKQNKSMLVNVKRQLLGQSKYSNILVTALKFKPTLDELNLSDNKLSPRTLHQILENGLKEGVKIINLTNNHIIELPNFQFSSLQVLILTNTGLTDDHIPQLLQRMPITLSVLDISYNVLSDQTMRHLGAYLIDNENLQELYLRWNRISGLGGQIFFEALVDNSVIKVIDLSHNSLGHPENICLDSLKTILMLPHPELLHFDISHNQFCPLDCKVIAKCISGNQQIYGMHLIGNQDWFIDAEGWAREKQVNNEPEKTNSADLKQLKPMKQIKFSEIKTVKINLTGLEQQVDPKHVERRIKSVEYIGENKLQNQDLNQFDNCWICEGWQEIKFEWVPGKSGEFTEEPLYIHLDFLKFKPINMEFYNKTFVLYKMCPPSRIIKFFFSNPLLLQIAVQNDKNTMNIPEDNNLNGLVLEYENDLNIRCCQVDYANFIETKASSVTINKKQNYSVQVNSRPRGHFRQQDMLDYLNQLNGEWALQNSIFRNFQADTMQLINECFEFDFATSRIPKLCENEEYSLVVKETIRPYYLYIFTAYKYYASSSQNIQFPCVPLSQFTEMLHKTKVLSNGGIRLTDVQVLFISSCSRESGVHDNFKFMADKAVVRFQFLEMIVRLAIDKYSKKGMMIDQCVIQLMDKDRLIDQLRTFDVSQDWRNARLWNKECDEVLTKATEIIKQIYLYATSFNLRTQNHRTKLLSYKDFHQMCEKAGIISSGLNDRDVLQIFFLSIVTQVNEVTQLNHFLMSQIEFMEALGRLAERLSPSIDKGKTVVQRRMQPLHEKLIILIFIFYKQLKAGIKKLYHRKALAYRDYERLILNEIGRRSMTVGKNKEDLELLRKKEIELKKKKILMKPFASARSADRERQQNHPRMASQKNRNDNSKRLIFNIQQLLGFNTDEKRPKRQQIFQKNPETFDVMKQLKYFENNR